MKQLLFIFLISCGLNALAQHTVHKSWDARFGGAESDRLHYICQSKEGGYILGGDSYSGISGNKTQSSQGDADY